MGAMAACTDSTGRFWVFWIEPDHTLHYRINGEGTEQLDGLWSTIFPNPQTGPNGEIFVSGFGKDNSGPYGIFDDGSGWSKAYPLGV